MTEREISLQDCLKRLREQDTKSPYRDRTRDGYTREEAEELINEIEKGIGTHCCVDDGTGNVTLYTKEEMIARIKADIRE